MTAAITDSRVAVTAYCILRPQMCRSARIPDECSSLGWVATRSAGPSMPSICPTGQRLTSTRLATTRYVDAMNWRWLKTRTAVNLALQDAWQEGGPRVLTGLSVNAIAVIVASIATQKPAALWTLFAYPIFMLSAWCFFFVRRMRGWNRLWKREIHITRTDQGPQINMSLRTIDPAHLLSGAGHELTCFVQEPGGSLSEAPFFQGFHRARVYCSYPFQVAGSLAPGNYIATWKEQDTRTGKWAIIDLSRFKLSEKDFDAPAAMPGVAGASP
jgi:hypothetical protein